MVAARIVILLALCISCTVRDALTDTQSFTPAALSDRVPERTERGLSDGVVTCYWGDSPAGRRISYTRRYEVFLGFEDNAREVVLTRKRYSEGLEITKQTLACGFGVFWAASTQPSQFLIGGIDAETAEKVFELWTFPDEGGQPLVSTNLPVRQELYRGQDLQPEYVHLDSQGRYFLAQDSRDACIYQVCQGEAFLLASSLDWPFLWRKAISVWHSEEGEYANTWIYLWPGFPAQAIVLYDVNDDGVFEKLETRSWTEVLPK